MKKLIVLLLFLSGALVSTGVLAMEQYDSTKVDNLNSKNIEFYQAHFFKQKDKKIKRRISLYDKLCAPNAPKDVRPYLFKIFCTQKIVSYLKSTSGSRWTDYNSVNYIIGKTEIASGFLHKVIRLLSAKEEFSVNNFDDDSKGEWKFVPDISTKQLIFCIALQHQFTDQREKPVNIGDNLQHTHNILHSLPPETQNKIFSFGWIKLPATKKSKLIDWIKTNPFSTAVVGTGLATVLGLGVKKTVDTFMKKKTDHS